MSRWQVSGLLLATAVLWGAFCGLAFSGNLWIAVTLAFVGSVFLAARSVRLWW